MSPRLNLLLFLMLCMASSYAQTDREFWFVAPNVDGNNANFNIPIVVRMTSFATPASVTISIPANPAFTPIVNTIAANSTLTVDLSSWLNLLQNAPSNTVLNKGILIQSTADITAYYEVVSSYCNCNPEVFSLKGKNALGTEFYISSQYTYSIDTVRHPAATTSFDIVATQDNTNITVTPAKNIVGHIAGIPFSIVLNKGQTWSAEAVYRDLNDHLQGSYVTSDKPIAITLKDDLVWGDGTCADLIGDQTIPTSVLGTEYIVSKGYLVPQDRVFVLATQDNTSVFRDGGGTAAVVLNKGQSWTFNLSNQSTYIRADNKIYVYHVTGNGCELGSAIIPKLNCTGSTSVSIVRSTNDPFAVMLTTKNGSQGSFTVNGSPAIVPAGNFTPVPGTGGNYVAATVDLSAFLPAGSVLNFANSTGKFAMGFLNGSAVGGCRYGFFSDFKSSNVQNSQLSVCLHDSAQLNAFGGIVYAWSPSTGLSSTAIANPKASPAVTTTYKAIITDAEGCTDSAFVTVNVDSFPVPDFSFDQDVCNPLQVSFSGNSQPGVTYTWNIGGVSYPGGQNLVHIFPQQGSFPVTLTVAPPAGCPDSIIKTIPVLVQAANAITTTDTTICYGGSKQLISVPSVDFCWTPAAYINNTALSNPVVNPPVTTTYYLNTKAISLNLISNGDFSNGNTGFTSTYVYDPVNKTEGEYFIGTDPHVWNPSAAIGCRDHTSGSGNMMMVNGSPAANIPVWTEHLAVTPNTNYTFSAWIESISGSNPAFLQFSINGFNLGNPITASINTCTWQQFYTSWNSGSNTTAIISLVNQNTIRSGNDFALDDITFAAVTLQTDSVIIRVDKPQVKAGPDTTVCSGMPVALNAAGALSYTWSPATGLSDSTISNPVARPKTTMQYVATGESANGCRASDTIVVSVFPPPVTHITPDTGICRQTSAQLYASGGITYSWQPAGLLDNPLSPHPIATPDTTTLFILTITDQYHCVSADSVTVSIRRVPMFQAPGGQTVCQGIATVLGANDNPKYTYSWSPASFLSDPTAVSPSATLDSSINYTVTIADSVCHNYDSLFLVPVLVIPAPEVVAQKNNDIDCSIHTTRLNATGALSYSWEPASGVNDPNIAAPVASIDSTTTFIVKGTAGNGCYAYDSVTVKVTATGKNIFVLPNAFTPNGDGHNDCFGLHSWGDVKVEEFSVFNRWGQMVFTTSNPSGCWDGAFRGQAQPAGAYAYVVRAMSACGEIRRTGVVMLIR